MGGSFPSPDAVLVAYAQALKILDEAPHRLPSFIKAVTTLYPELGRFITQYVQERMIPVLSIEIVDQHPFEGLAIPRVYMVYSQARFSGFPTTEIWSTLDVLRGTENPFEHLEFNKGRYKVFPFQEDISI